MSPRQASKEFYKQKQRSVIGFGIYYNENDSIKCINVDLISDNLNQTGNSSVCAFRYVLIWTYFTWSYLKQSYSSSIPKVFEEKLCIRIYAKSVYILFSERLYRKF